MKGKLLLRIFLVSMILLLIIPVFNSCSGAVGGWGDEFEVIRQAADSYVNSGKPLNITADVLYAKMMKSIDRVDKNIIWYDPTSYSTGPIVVDLRNPEGELPDSYYNGHIPGAIKINWRDITQWRNLNRLPKDRQVVVYSNTGGTGAQVTAILNVLGYNAVNLAWGITSWSADKNVAPGRYDKERDTVWNWGGSYRAICPISEPTDIYSLPVVKNSQSSDNFEIIRAAADNYLGSGKPDSMSSPELYNILYFEQRSDTERATYFTNPLNPGENPYVVPFLLDVRDEETYLNGHLCGCLHVFWKDVFKTENLKLLPPDRQILVYDTNGHYGSEITALLNLLGYDAISLKWGMTSWSLSLPGKDVAPDRYLESRDCMGYSVVTGYQAFIQCPG
jgi:rhodanese-related sulfurtransferase